MAFVATPTNLFRPTNITGCSVWLDAADSSTITISSGTVSQWRDKSGNGRNANGTGSIYTTNVQNGLSAINFTTGNTPLSLPSFVLSPLNKISAFVVIRASANGGGQNADFLIDGADYSVFTMNYLNGTSNYALYIYDGNGINTGVNIVGSTNITEGIYDGTTVTPYINGTAYTSAARSGTNLTTSRTLYIGAYGTRAFICEILLYNNSLSTTDRQQIEGYLAWKWGLVANLPSNHPYKNTSLSSSLPFPTVISPNVNTITPVRYGTNSTVFNPTSVSGLRYWYDASDPTVVTSSGTNLLSIRNKGSLTQNSLNSNQNIATTGTFKVNGLNVVRLPANTRLLYTGDYTLGNPRTHMIVSRPLINNTTTEVNFLWQNVGFNAEDYFGVNTKIIELAQGYAVYIETTAVVPNLSNVPALFGVVLSSSNIASVNGSNLPLLTNAPPAYNNSNNAPFYVNANTGSAQDFCEFLSWNRALSLSEFQQVEGYLAWKWGLTSSLSNGHPYKTPIAPFSYAVRQTGQSIWSPLNLSGCALWLDAADMNTFTPSSPTNGTAISQWSDKSGNGRHATQATSGNRPVYSSSDKSVDTTTNPRYFNMTNMPSAPYDIFVVARPVSTTTDWRTLFRTNTTDPGMNPIALEATTTRLGYFTSTGFEQFGTYTWAASTRNLLFARMNSTKTMNASLNGAISLTANTAVGTASDVILYMGALVVSGSVFQQWGNINEVIFYTTPLTTAQRQQVEGYLAWKWGLQSSLPSNHPYKNIPPSP